MGKTALKYRVVTDYRPVFNEFYKGGTNIKKILILRPKLGVQTLFLGNQFMIFAYFAQLDYSHTLNFSVLQTKLGVH